MGKFMTGKSRVEVHMTPPRPLRDLLRGVPKIAPVHRPKTSGELLLLEKRRIPAGKEGSAWVKQQKLHCALTTSA